MRRRGTGNLSQQEDWNQRREKGGTGLAAQAAWHYAASQQIWLVEAGLLLISFRALRDDLGALGIDGLGALRYDLGALLLGCTIHGNSTESEGSSGHQRHQFLHLAVLLWIAIIQDRLGQS